MQEMATHLLEHDDGFADVRILESTWLVYFGDHADAIARDGFLKGLPIEDVSGLCHPSSGESHGWNFAFDATDEYSLRTLVEHDLFGDDFEKAVLFRAPGVACVHKRDRFGQVVFRGRDAQAPFLVVERIVDEDDDGEPQDAPWSFAGRTHEDLFAAMDAAIAQAEAPTP